jgi:Asp-tRNA(Asn)/Glu-tRNA(Gln) amidotransferase A subunit family amidase
MLAELRTAVRADRASPRELVAEAYRRIAERNAPLNAVIALRPEEEAVAEADALHAGTSEADLPLLGVPLLVKDNEDAAGMRTTFGSLLRVDAPLATRDAEVVLRLRGAGAIVVGKTNIPEFAFEGFTANRLFGVTRNPWAMEWSPGGSSGGSGAALMAGIAPLVTGTDGGGSIRIPAAFCGFVGLKPTNGLIGQWPPPSWIDLSTKGPLAVSVADARLLLDVLRGPIDGAPSAAPSWSPDLNAMPSRILATERLVGYDEPLPADLPDLFARALERLEAATGLEVVKIDPPFPPQLDEDWFTLCAAEELAWWGRDLLIERMEDLSSSIQGVVRAAAEIDVVAYLAARRRRFDFARQADELLGRDAILVCPTVCVGGFPADGTIPGQDRPGTDSIHYNNNPGNVTGQPSISVPAGISGIGVPFGLEISGPRYRDDLILNVAERWEAANPWPLSASGYDPFPVP